MARCTKSFYAKCVASSKVKCEGSGQGVPYQMDLFPLHLSGEGIYLIHKQMQELRWHIFESAQIFGRSVSHASMNLCLTHTSVNPSLLFQHIATGIDVKLLWSGK